MLSTRPAPTAATRPAPPAALALALASTSEDRRGELLTALADALAGALGSVVAVAVFYPIDIAKTRAQASSASASCKHPDHGDYRGERQCNRGAARPPAGTVPGGRERQGWFRSRTLAALMSIVRNEGGLTRVYEGIEAKALQALLGSFVYFYAYTFIKGVMRRRTAVGGGATKSLRPSLNLLAAAMAGAVNQAFTLPLENITTRIQTAPQHPPPPPPPPPGTGATTRLSAEGSSSSVGTETRGGGGSAGARMGQGGACSDGANDGGGHGVVKTPELADSRGDDGVRVIDQFVGVPAPAAAPAKTLQEGEEKGDGTDDRENDLPPARRRQRQRQRPRQSFAAVTGELYREGGGVGRFWRGFAPSLILTCNPAINYTAFDMLKALWLRRRDAAAAPVLGTGGTGGVGGVAAGGGGTARRKGTGGFLNPLEAFFVAAAAKSLATVVTYPLIRAKVVLMTSRSSSPIVDVNNYPVSTRPLQRGGDGASGASRRSTTQTQHVDCGVGEGRDGAAGRTAVKAETGTGVGSPVTGRGEPEEMDTRVVPAAAAAAAAAAAVEEGRNGEFEGSNTRGMGSVLVEIFRREGFGGLYAGCGAQLLHTILKSALLLATKEQIARAAASAVFFGGNRSGAAGSTKSRAGTG